MSATSQKEYLKKYLSGPSKDEKKKKKKYAKIKGQGMKIIDDDVDLSKMRALDDDELDLLGDNEDAPQVAGIVDERPDEVKRLEQFSREKWKVITEDDGFNSSLTVQQISKKFPDIVRSDKSDSDLSPLRNNEREDSDISLERPKSNVDRLKSAKNGNSTIIKSKKCSDSDLSPDRRKKNGSDSDLSPVRDRFKKESGRREVKNRNNSDSDLSPPRNKKRLEEPKKKDRSRKHNSDLDLSPPRSRRIDHAKDDVYKSSGKNRESDLSRRIKQESDSDLSPQRGKNCDSKTTRHKSPEREREKHRNQSDPRRAEKDDRRVRHRDNEQNFGNKRDFVENANKTRTDDFKSKDRRKNSGSDSDLHLRKEVEVRKTKDRGKRKRSRWADPDEELGQQILENISKNKNRSNESSSRSDRDEVRKHGTHASGKRDHRQDNRQSSDRYTDKYNSKKSFDDRNSSRVTNLSNDRGDDGRGNDSRISERKDDDNRSTRKMERTLDGKKAGLQDARQLKQENLEFKAKEAQLFDNLSEEFSGRNAKAIKRDLKGKRETEEDRQKKREKEVKDKELEAKYHQWGKGLKQVEEQEANIRDYMHEASKPLARHRDDRDLESALRQKERDGDPMLEYMRRKETEKGAQGDTPVRPIYKGPYPPNRFDIRPGHRWDGVDRSNGHEAAVFQARSSKKALDSEQYKWSTEDM